ncbi:HPF/RaiA family ribosome-associated protein [Lentzea alba]|uniref:sigma 54 modulation/S30EA ribosomal C-terminal domain-containing protein n=1 Tax=Lentzea alba TaxID=2714351 RepID=UPI0039BF970C
MRRGHQAAAPEVQVSEHGTFPLGVADYAREKVAAVLPLAHEPVLSARVRLTRHEDPAVELPVVVQVNLDVNGRMIRAVAEGPTTREAVDVVEGRLRHRLERAARHWEAIRGVEPSAEPHEWRHGELPEHRPGWFPRPVDEREIVRHKSFTPARITLDEAAFEMDQMDYDFHLFTEQNTGQDSVLYRAGPTGYRLAQVDPAPVEQLSGHSTPMTISAVPAPLLSTDEAVTRLEATGLPFLFFLEGEHARGHVLYHRYDGHYGLLSPASG